MPTGDYSLTLTSVGGGCASSPVVPGGGALNGTLGGSDCRFTDDSFFDPFSFVGTAGQRISITYTPTFDGIVYLLDASRTIIAVDGGAGGSFNARIPASGLVTLPTTGTYFVVAGSVPRANPGAPTPTGSYSLTIEDGGQCPTAPITTGQTINNSLNLGECALPDETLVDFYTFNGTAGQEVAISLSSPAFDAFLFLNGPAGTVVAENDDGGGGTVDSRIPAGSGFFTLPATGTYTILANTFPPGRAPPTGNYTLSLTGNIPPASDVQFAATSLSATEGTDRSVVVNVTRTGVTTGETFVSFATADGTTNERRDYTIALGSPPLRRGRDQQELRGGHHRRRLRRRPGDLQHHAQQPGRRHARRAEHRHRHHHQQRREPTAPARSGTRASTPSSSSASTTQTFSGGCRIRTDSTSGSGRRASAAPPTRSSAASTPRRPSSSPSRIRRPGI